jgi:hypothetical protein
MPPKIGRNGNIHRGINIFLAFNRVSNRREEDGGACPLPREGTRIATALEFLFVVQENAASC